MRPGETRYGDFFRQRREDLDLSQEQVGDYIGVSKAMVSKIENNKSGTPRGERLRRYLEILQIDPTELVDHGQARLVADAIDRVADSNNRIAEAIASLSHPVSR